MSNTYPYFTIYPVENNSFQPSEPLFKSTESTPLASMHEYLLLMKEVDSKYFNEIQYCELEDEDCNFAVLQRHNDEENSMFFFTASYNPELINFFNE